MPASVRLPIFTRVNGEEVSLGTVDVPVDVEALLVAKASETAPLVQDFDEAPPGVGDFGVFQPVLDLGGR